MKRITIYFIFIVACNHLSASAQSLFRHGRLTTSADGHALQFKDGTPFFWLGDTGWELFHRLNLTEIKTYLDNRAKKGFNVIQAVALPEFNGLKSPNRYGQLPLHNLDPRKPNSSYFKVIDSTIRMARERNLFIGLLPTWGDKVTKLWGEGPVVFDSSNAYAYGAWLGKRYKSEDNIIWILGGDRPAMTDSNDWRPIWRAMAAGIHTATKGNCFITYHPWGGDQSTSQWLHNDSWLDLNMFQSGHGGGHDVPCWEIVKRDLAYKPAKPTLDAEPNYEDHPVSPWPKWDVEKGYYRDYDVRKQSYRSVFAGACGVTYGHHAIWQFMNEREQAINYPDRGWVNAMDRPGAFQVGYLKTLMESRPMQGRIPDNSIILEGQGEKAEHMEAFIGPDSSYMMLYMPIGKTISIRSAIFKNAITAWWFNPTDASSKSIGMLKKDAAIELTPPSTGFGNDWILIIDDVTKKYSIPAWK